MGAGCSCWVVAVLALSITTRLLRGCLRNSRLTQRRHLRWSGRPGLMREKNTSVEKSRSCAMSRLSTLMDQARNTTGSQIWLLGTLHRSTLRRALRQHSFWSRKPTARFSWPIPQASYLLTLAELIRTAWMRWRVLLVTCPNGCMHTILDGIGRRTSGLPRFITRTVISISLVSKYQLRNAELNLTLEHFLEAAGKSKLPISRSHSALALIWLCISLPGEPFVGRTRHR